MWRYWLAVSNFNVGYLASDIITRMGIPLTTSMKRYLDKKDSQMNAPIKKKMRNKKLEKDLAYERGAHWAWESSLNFRGNFLECKLLTFMCFFLLCFSTDFLHLFCVCRTWNSLKDCQSRYLLQVIYFLVPLEMSTILRTIRNHLFLKKYCKIWVH